MLDASSLPGVSVQLDHRPSPGSVEGDELVDVSVFPILSLLLQEVETEQTAHAVTDQGHSLPPRSESSLLKVFSFSTRTFDKCPRLVS